MISIPGLTLEESTHRYRYHGAPVSGVTEILQGAGIIDPTWYTEESRIRGQHVHQAAHYLDEDDLALESVRPEIRPYLDGYIAFRRASGFIPLLLEQRVIHSLGFAGTLDRVGLLNNRLVLADIKSGGVPKWARIQTGGYDLALEEMIRAGLIKLAGFPEAHFAIQLPGDGTYRLQPLDRIAGRAEFLEALEKFNRKEAEHGQPIQEHSPA